MKKILLYLVSVGALTACSSPESTNSIVSNLDSDISPQSDFYQFATGGWQLEHPLPDAYARYGSFDKLISDNQGQVKTLIEGLSTQKQDPGSEAFKIASMYTLSMDTLRLDKEGSTPVKQTVEEIMALSDRESFIAYVVQLHHQGFSPYFGIYASGDSKNSDMNIAWLFQNGIGMGERDYYLEQDENTLKLREAYQIYLQSIFAATGYALEESQRMKEGVMRVETALAKQMMPLAEMRDPHKIYNKMSLDDLGKLVPQIDWSSYFSQQGVRDMDSLSVGMVAYMRALQGLLQTLPLEDLKSQLAAYYLHEASPFLGKTYTDAHFAFFSVAMRGIKEKKERWKEAVDMVNYSLGEAVGKLYVEKHFPASSKERMMDLVAQVKAAFAERIGLVTWMCDETKGKALEKLETFRVKIGYPDRWKSYATLDIRPEESYFTNYKRVMQFQHREMLSELNRPVDRDKWLMNAHEVNAYYNPSTNEICFPAGILQPPFFFADGDDALNYGAIGVVIAHEMSHGFDDQGRKSDKYGNLVEWWTAEDARQFDERTQVLVDHFNSIEVAPGLHADGRLSLGENIADLGGIEISYHAFQKTSQFSKDKKLEDFTPAQRFFIAYAGVWAGNIRDQEIIRRTKEDVHSLGRWRVNGTLPHVTAWAEAFDVKPGDALYIAPNKRAKIW